MPLPKELFTVSNYFTLICTGLTCYLLAQVVIKFAITKPTSTSEELVELDLITFPDVVVCLDPPFDDEALASFGYKTIDYFAGRIDNSFVGWNGLNGEHNYTHILNSALTLRRDKEIFNSTFFIDRTEKTINTKAQFKTLLYPYGKCLLVKPKENMTSFKNLFLKSNAADWSSDVHLNVFLMDPVNSPMILPEFFQMKGDYIRVPLMKEVHSFVTRISRTYHIEGNPTFPCKEYNQGQS